MSCLDSGFYLISVEGQSKHSMGFPHVFAQVFLKLFAFLEVGLSEVLALS